MSRFWRPGCSAGLLAVLLWGFASEAALADIAQVTKVQDVTFTSLDPMLGASSSQSLCVFSSALTTLYTVTATGSGVGSAFTLSAGNSVPPLPYSVLWSTLPGQTTGTALTAATPLPNEASSATSLLCVLGLGTSASLTVSLASSDLQAAVSGVTYTGQLSITITAQ